MDKIENKTAAALDALKKIRERVKPMQDTPAAAKEEATEEEYLGVKIRDDVDRELVQIFFRNIPTGKVRTYLKKHGFAWDAGERCWQCERVENAGYHARKAVDRGVGK